MRQFVSSLVMGLVATIATSSVSFAAMLTGGASFNNTLTDLVDPALPTASQILDFQTANTAAGDFSVGMGWGTLNISTYQVTNGTAMGPISGAAGDFSGTWTAILGRHRVEATAPDRCPSPEPCQGQGLLTPPRS
ncbi:MAG: hypothetical protein ACKN9U_07420 [Pirellulaceae bacterium]